MDKVRYEKYERFFVMLDEQSGDFAMRQSTRCGGHIKIETGGGKGAMRIGVRNLKFYEKTDYIYKLILFGTVREKTIYAIVGTVNVNKIGSGETYFTFDVTDVGGSGYELAAFSYAIVAAVSMTDENEPLHPVMKGIVEVPFYNAREELRNQSSEIQAAENSSAEDSVMTEENAPAANSDLASTGQSVQDFGEYTHKSEHICYNSYYNKHIIGQIVQISEKQTAYDRVFPFKEDVTEAEWSKIDPETDFPIISPGSCKMIEKYKHYIFGKADGMYYLGVPGRFLREEQPEAGESGFLLWQPIVGAEELCATDENATDEARYMAYGYWIVAIDAENGDILEA